MNGIVRAVLRHDRLRRRVLAAVVAGGAFAAPTSCDPTTGESTLTGRLSVEMSTTCSVEGECDTIHLVVTGERFAPGSHLKIHMPSGQVAGLGAVVIGADVVVGGNGAFRAVERYAPCTVVARPGDARRVLSLVADDVRADVRRAATFVGSEHVVCRPPFTRLARAHRVWVARPVPDAQHGQLEHDRGPLDQPGGRLRPFHDPVRPDGRRHLDPDP